METKKKPLELYIHIPFCLQKCLYCDFLSFRGSEDVKAQYMDQLRCEIMTSGAWYQDYAVTTIFIGGGTPSCLEAEQITMLMQAVRRAFEVLPEAEITIEANPGTRLAHKLDAYREAGINRLSLGLQSANNEELKLLGRIHSFEDFLKSFQSARMAGFQNINVDLMSALPGQSAEAWRNTVRKMIMLKPEHISAYSLIVEPGTAFGNHYKVMEGLEEEGADEEAPGDEQGMPFAELQDSQQNLLQTAGSTMSQQPPKDPLADWPPLPDEEEERKMYYLTKTFLEEAGYRRYEISNYARPGKECRHNIGYWTGVEYLGFGLGASSCTKNKRFSNLRDMKTYLDLDFSMDGLDRLHGDVHRQTIREQMEEFMFLGLRLTDGVSEEAFTREFGARIENIYGPIIEKLIEEKLLVRRDQKLALTDYGLDVSNYVMSEFLLDGEPEI